jgi:NAD(P)H-dependent flavin oxidoreductase YrpB (nitropropane dioxygenase family)
VSSWKLARELARSGELGIISGTAMDVVVLRWLQDGDPGGLYRKALAAFPDQGMAQRFIDKYYVEGGKAADKPYAPLQMWQLDASQALREACVLGNFCEVGKGYCSPRRRPRAVASKSSARNEPVRVWA